MGQKVNPFVLRVGFTKTWHSRWFAKPREYARLIEQDFKVRKYIAKKFKQAAVSDIIIERLTDKVRIRICSARPGIIIGRHGADIEQLRGDLNSMVGKEVAIDIAEIKNPALDARLVGQNVALQIERRVAFRRAVKRAIEQSMNSGAEGIKIIVSGRLGGAEIAREETYKQGKIPLATLRADIDYALSEALTECGLIGIKVWIYKGEILDKNAVTRAAALAPKQEKEIKKG
ncbi:30S ribosomal protein S3 [Candidatus Omnitrophota bacterium]